MGIKYGFGNVRFTFVVNHHHHQYSVMIMEYYIVGLWGNGGSGSGREKYRNYYIVVFSKAKRHKATFSK